MAISYSARMLGMGDGVDMDWRHNGIQRRDNNKVVDIEGAKPKPKYVRDRIPERHRIPEVRSATEAPELGNRQIQQARRVHAYSRQHVPRQPEIPGNHPRKLILNDWNKNGLVDYNEPIEGTRPNPHYRGHDDTAFNSNRRAPKNPQEPQYKSLGDTLACLPYDRAVEDGPLRAEPPKFGRRAPRPPSRDRVMDVSDIEGSRPKRHFNAGSCPVQTRNIMKNDDVEGATTWNWKPLHKRFIGGSHAPRALHAEQAAPKLGPTTGLANHDHDLARTASHAGRAHGAMVQHQGESQVAGRPNLGTARSQNPGGGPGSVLDVGGPNEGYQIGHSDCLTTK